MNDLMLKTHAELGLNISLILIVVIAVCAIVIAVSSIVFYKIYRSSFDYESIEWCFPSIFISYIVFCVCCIALVVPNIGSSRYEINLESLQNDYSVGVIKCANDSDCRYNGSPSVNAGENAIVDVSFFKNGKNENGVIIVDGSAHRAGLFYRTNGDGKRSSDGHEYIPVDSMNTDDYSK